VFYTEPDYRCPKCDVAIYLPHPAYQIPACPVCGNPHEYDDPEYTNLEPEDQYWDDQARLGLLDVDPDRATKRKRK